MFSWSEIFLFLIKFVIWWVYYIYKFLMIDLVSLVEALIYSFSGLYKFFLYIMFLYKSSTTRTVSLMLMFFSVSENHTAAAWFFDFSSWSVDVSVFAWFVKLCEAPIIINFIELFVRLHSIDLSKHHSWGFSVGSLIGEADFVVFGLSFNEDPKTIKTL